MSPNTVLRAAKILTMNRAQPEATHIAVRESRVLVVAQRISVANALRTILGAAHTLHLDHRVGSIEVGKQADFCVLDDDPIAAPRAELHEVRIAGAVFGGPSN